LLEAQSEGPGIDSEEALALAFVSEFSPLQMDQKKLGDNSDRKNEPEP